jgi:hypothetical protein
MNHCRQFPRQAVRPTELGLLEGNQNSCQKQEQVKDTPQRID